MESTLDVRETLTIRPFVSSTFLDFQEEREILVKHVFPQIGLLCQKKGLFFAPVDLRWGITSEDTAGGNVIRLCLEEINKSTPFFIGLLGQRYGWAQRPDKADDLLSHTFNIASRNNPWLENHKECSVTEIEVIHGVLNRLDEIKSKGLESTVLFCMRSAAYLDTIGEDALKNFQEQDESILKKLEDLKEKIRGTGLPVYEYTHPSEAAEFIHTHLTNAINTLFPAERNLSGLEISRLAHEQFARTHGASYVAQPDVIAQLEEHLMSDAHAPFVLTGEFGSGKTATLANWSAVCKEKGYFCIGHFIGCTPDSAEVNDILVRFVTELYQEFSLVKELPTSREELVRDFPVILSEIACHLGNKKIVLILDGVNHLDEYENDLHWFPQTFPSDIRVYLSMTSLTTSHNECQRRGYPECKLTPLTREMTEEFVVKYLEVYGKRLGTNHLAQIVSHPESPSPLFTRIMLDQLRMFSVHAVLDTEITSYEHIHSIPDLYSKVLDRCEQEYDEDGVWGENSIFGQYLGLLAVAHKGLSEAELIDMIKVPRVQLSAVGIATTSFFVLCGGRLCFVHNSLRSAVVKRYVGTKEQDTSMRTQLVNHLEEKTLDTGLANEEVLHQHISLQQWEPLKAYITNPVLFNQLNTSKGRPLLAQCWRLMKEKGLKPSECLSGEIKTWLSKDLRSERNHEEKGNEHNSTVVDEKPVCEDSDSSDKAILSDVLVVAKGAVVFLSEIQEFSSVKNIASSCLEVLPANTELFLEWASYLVNALLNLDLLDKAGEILDTNLPVAAKTLGEKHHQTAALILALANLKQRKGEPEAAEKNYDKAIAIYREVLGPTHSKTLKALNSLSALYLKILAWDKACVVMETVVEITERTQGSRSLRLVDAFLVLSGVYKRTRRWEEGHVLLQRALDAAQWLLGETHARIADICNSIAAMYCMEAKYSEAEPFFKRVLTIREKVCKTGEADLGIALFNLANFYYNQGRSGEAEGYYIRLLSNEAGLSRELYENPFVTQASYKTAVINLANIYFYHTDKKYEQAKPLYREIVDGLENSPELVAPLRNLGEIYRSENNTLEYKACLQKLLAIKTDMQGSDHEDCQELKKEIRKCDRMTSRSCCLQ